jgi:4a-hydroxytetrahydrobiopterin dehydratase
MGLLSNTEVAKKLAELNGWHLAGVEIKKSFALKDFVRAMGFVNSVALLAEKANHIRWNTVTLTLSTHSEGGLTEKDFKLAAEIEAL